MINFWETPFGSIFSLFRSGARGLYNFGYQTINAAAQFNTYSRDREKLAAVLSNPALLKVFALQCDLFSMGNVCVEDIKTGEKIEDDPFLSLISNPNPMPGSCKSQFLWDYMFWLMLGNARCYIDSRIVDRQDNLMYWLDPTKIEWPQGLDRMKDKLIFSRSQINQVMDTVITYRYDDGSTFQFPLKKMLMNYDLTAGVGNYYKGISRIDALYKIISNSEYTLDSDNINIRYSGKFLVGSPNETGTTTKVGMSKEEKEDLEKKIDTDEKKVWPLRSMIQIRRFVEDMAKLQLGEKYLQTYFLIGNMYNIPRDVLEAYNSATYENQEKARAAHVNYTLDPKGNQFMNSFERHFGYQEAGKNIYITWDHLPFMQVFERERAETRKINIETLNSLLQSGITIDQANEYLNTQFEIQEPEEIADTNSSPETLAAQAALRGSVGGVQGILEVQASVVAGTTTRSSALSILTIIFGFTDEQAQQILGDPEDVQLQQEETTGQQGGQGSTEEGSSSEDEGNGERQDSEEVNDEE